jgi:hypothetical protein
MSKDGGESAQASGRVPGEEKERRRERVGRGHVTACALFSSLLSPCPSPRRRLWTIFSYSLQ